jgi:hypothetical protein
VYVAKPSRIAPLLQESGRRKGVFDMQMRSRFVVLAVATWALLVGASNARGQSQGVDGRWAVDFAAGISPSVKGNINTGVIGTLQGQTVAVVPHTYSDVYGNSIDWHFGGGYMLNSDSEIHGAFIYQSTAANLVRLGDLGPSSLYGQFSDYKSWALDVGYRRYLALSVAHVYAEGTIGIADIQRINVQFAAPQSNLIINNADFYDGTAAFTWGIGVGVLFPIAKQVEFNAQLGLRHVGGLAEVDQFAGTSLSAINNDSARLSFPITVGVRYRFR